MVALNLAIHKENRQIGKNYTVSLRDDFFFEGGEESRPQFKNKPVGKKDSGSRV